jgi:hypothetical protein
MHKIEKAIRGYMQNSMNLKSIFFIKKAANNDSKKNLT